MKNNITFLLLTSGAVMTGFFVGFGIGKETRDATPSNVETNYSGGVVTITADVGNALRQGVSGFFARLGENE